ncbi:MAG: DUF2723 domain-containing protein, partial [Elusimicrobiota bacterium]|nr:DUF2723 domain-containing protein [Elusimicrobiota bacterium]
MKLLISSCIIFLVVFFCYLQALAPTISTGDTAELAGASANLGIAHSPGYPLYCNSGKILSILIPFGNHAFRMNLSSAVFSALSAIAIFLIAYFLSDSILIPIIVTFTFSFLKSCFSQALISEVFALNTFFCCLIILFVLLPDEKINFHSRLYLVCLLSGLGLGNHHTIIFLFPALTLWVIFNRKKILQGAWFTILLNCSLLFILGLGIYFYLPLRSLKEPLYDWEDPQTLQRFFNVVTRSRYGTFQLAQGATPGISFRDIFNGISAYFFLTDFPLYIFLLLILSSIVNFTKANFKKTMILISALYFTGPFFLSLAKVSSVGPNLRYVLERFLPLSFIPLTLIFCLGLNFFKKFSPLRQLIC